MACEYGVRKYVMPRSRSSNQIDGLKVFASSLDSKNTNVAVLGNSFTICGIDTDHLISTAKSNGDQNLSLGICAIHGSYICEWYWLSKLWCMPADEKPDIIVLNTDGRSLLDQKSIEHRRLALTFGPSKMPLFPDRDLAESKKELEFLFSRFSMLVNRGRNIGTQINTSIIPNFQKVNSFLASRKTQEFETHQEEPREQNAAASSIAKRFLEDCRELDIRTIVVLMPHREVYELPDSIIELLGQYSDTVSIIDHRRLNEINDSDFKDGVHLNTQGMQKYTERYTSDLVDQIRMTHQGNSMKTEDEN